MKVKYRKSLAIIGSAFLSLLVLAPANGAPGDAFEGSTIGTNVNPSAAYVSAGPTIVSVETMGIINVVSKVVNDNIGTKLPSDFIFSVKHWGTDVVGSPFAGADGEGVTFTVAPGSYVVHTPVIDGYLGSWSGEGTVAGLVMLEAGQVVTITRTSEDVGPFGPYEVYVPINNPTTENGGNTPTTENGGTLPDTSSPWFNAIGAGLLLSAAGAFGLRKSRVLS